MDKDFIYNGIMKKKIIYSSIAIIITAALIGGLIYSLLPETMVPNPAYLAGNTAGNLHNGGLFCEAGGKVYFSNSYDNGNLYVMNVDETEVKRLNELNVSSINVGGDYIYFCQGTSRFTGEGFGLFRAQPGLYRSRINGRDIKTLKANSVVTATLCGNEIFYQNFDPRDNRRQNQLFRIGTDGEGDRQVSGEIINPSSFVNGLIYYSRTETDHFVYALDVQSGFSQVIFEANTYKAIYEGGYIYFMDLDNNYRLCRYSVFDNTIEILTNDRVDLYNIGNGVIFYQKNSRSEPALIRMDLDGRNQEIIREGNHNNINMTSRYVYFQEFGDEVTTYRTSLYGAPNVGIFRP